MTLRTTRWDFCLIAFSWLGIWSIRNQRMATISGENQGPAEVWAHSGLPSHALEFPPDAEGDEDEKYDDSGTESASSDGENVRARYHETLIIMDYMHKR